MRKILLIITCSLCGYLQAQKLTVESMTLAANDISVSKYERKDLNGQPCALVKVLFASPEAKFEGNVIGNVEYKTGEYWVYMSKGSRELRIKHPKAQPIQVIFSNYGVTKVESKQTYTLSVLLPQSSTSEQTQKLIINYTPTNAMVLVDSKPYKGNGRVEVTLPVGSHNYIIAAEGYETAEATIKLSATAPRTVTEALVATARPVIAQQPTTQPDTKQTPVTQNIPSEDAEIAGKTPAQICLLGFDYDVGRNGKVQDCAKALRFYQIAAEQGHSEAQWRLGYLYRDGKGVTTNHAEALKWFKKSAEQGNVYGQYYLGYMYYNNKNDFEALKYFKMAAEQGNAGAQNMLGYMYEMGKGIDKDYSKAVDWYRKAAEQGNSQAQFYLGLCYQYGKGVTKDLTQAKYWYEKAAAQGNENAQKELKKLK